MWVILYFLYLLFSDIYIYFPPLLGLFFIFYMRARETRAFATIFFIILAGFIFEMDKFSSIGIILILYIILDFLIAKFISKIINQNFTLECLYIAGFYVSYCIAINIKSAILIKSPYNFNFDFNYLIALYIVFEIGILGIIRLYKLTKSRLYA